MTFLIIVLSLFLLRSLSIEIPGCPDITRISESAGELEGEKLDQIKCVCVSDAARERGGGIEVNCVFGASLGDLANVLDAIGSLNLTAQQINLNHITVSNSTSLLQALDYESAEFVEAIEIKNCHGGQLEIVGSGNETTSEFHELQMLTIENCGLNAIPSELIERTTKLQTLSLNNNKIGFISVDNLKKAASNLEYLDLTENLINNTEEGALGQLHKVRTLLIGEHNFANSTLLEEISQIDNLETLDLTRIDGINSVDQLEFRNDSRLERLVLTGCNIKSVRSNSFSSLVHLKELDMRVNLIEKLEPGSFSGLKNLERVSLAGNFIKETEVQADRWTDLTNLTQFDLGWNELKVLRANSFGSEIGRKLHILSLRSNERLTKIENDAFSGLVNLANLNLSGSALEQLDGNPFNGLDSLEFLDLSNNNLSSIDPQVFSPMKGRLKSLNLANNRLRSLDLEAFDLPNLTEIDLSENTWLCDSKILKVSGWIKTRYLNAAKTSKSFLLINAGKTVCDRPYTLKGRSIMDLKPDEVSAIYEEKLDTTTTVLPVIQNVTEDVIAPNATTLIDFSKLIFDIGIKNDSLDVDINERKPAYDINLIKYGQRPVKESDNTWISAVVVIGLLALTIAGVGIVIRNKIRRSMTIETPTEQR